MLIELDDAVSLRISDFIAKDGCASFDIGRRLQNTLEAPSVEYVVAQDERDMIVSDEVCSKDKSLC